MYAAVTENQVELEGKVRAVHVIPSVDEAAVVDGPVATAAKTPVVGLTVTEIQDEQIGRAHV